MDTYWLVIDLDSDASWGPFKDEAEARQFAADVPNRTAMTYQTRMAITVTNLRRDIHSRVKYGV